MKMFCVLDCFGFFWLVFHLQFSHCSERRVGEDEVGGWVGTCKFNLKVALKYLISQVYSGYDLQGSNAVSVAKFCKSISIIFFFFSWRGSSYDNHLSRQNHPESTFFFFINVTPCSNHFFFFLMQNALSLRFQKG